MYALPHWLLFAPSSYNAYELKFYSRNAHTPFTQLTRRTHSKKRLLIDDSFHQQASKKKYWLLLLRQRHVFCRPMPGTSMWWTPTQCSPILWSCMLHTPMSCLCMLCMLMSCTVVLPVRINSGRLTGVIVPKVVFRGLTETCQYNH